MEQSQNHKHNYRTDQNPLPTLDANGSKKMHKRRVRWRSTTPHDISEPIK